MDTVVQIDSKCPPVWAFSSAVERSVHIGKVIGPTPIMPTKYDPSPNFAKHWVATCFAQQRMGLFAPRRLRELMIGNGVIF